METLNATDFKARCLAILDRVAETGERVVILKRGQPVAEPGPASRSRATYPQWKRWRRRSRPTGRDGHRDGRCPR